MATKKKTEPAQAPQPEPTPEIIETESQALAESPVEPAVQPEPTPVDVRVTRDSLQAEVAAIEQQKAELQNRQDALAHRLSRANQQVAEMEPPQDTMDAIRQYINSQNLSTKARFDRQQALIDMGAEPEELTSVRSPLDQSLKRKR